MFYSDVKQTFYSNQTCNFQGIVLFTIINKDKTLHPVTTTALDLGQDAPNKCFSRRMFINVSAHFTICVVYFPTEKF